MSVCTSDDRAQTAETRHQAKSKRRKDFTRGLWMVEARAASQRSAELKPTPARGDQQARQRAGSTFFKEGGIRAARPKVCQQFRGVAFELRP